MRGRGHGLDLRDDVVVGVAYPDRRADGDVHHRSEAVVHPVGRANLELLVEEEVGRNVQRARRVEGRLEHCEGLELQVRGKVEHVSTGQEVVLGLGAVLHAVEVKVVGLEHVGHRKGNVVPVGVVEKARTDIEVAIAGVLAEPAVGGNRKGRGDLTEEAHLLQGHPCLDAQGKAVLAPKVKRIGEVTVDVLFLDRTDLVGYDREPQADVPACRGVAREGEGGGCTLDVNPLLPVEQPEGEVLLGSRIGRVDNVHVVHVLRVVRILLGPDLSQGNHR